MRYIFPVILFMAISSNLFAQSDNIKQNALVPDTMNVETLPEYPGGEKAMYSFIIKNLQYPQAAKEMGIQGKVYVKFAVDTDGKVTDIQILKSLSKECDQEVLRVIKLMPDWKPATRGGAPIKAYYTLPVKFALN